MTKRIQRKGRFWVYIVECRDGTYYTGYTTDIERRIKLHNSGRGAKYTRDRRPVELVWSKEYKYFKSAFLEEKRIKKLQRKEKEGLVRQGRKSKHLCRHCDKNLCDDSIASKSKSIAVVYNKNY